MNKLSFVFGDNDRSRESFADAKEPIDKMGMHRWDFEAEELEKEVINKQ